MDQHLEEQTIFALATTPHQTLIARQTLDTLTACHLATVIDPPSLNHSWRVVSSFNLTKWKSFTTLPKGITESAVLKRPAQ